jgi:hypothetical protein
MPNQHTPAFFKSYVCEQCGTGFVKRDCPSEARRNYKFCSRACYFKAKQGLPFPKENPLPEERACIVCDKPFMVGGRGNKNRHTNCCSRTCANLARYRRGRIGSTFSDTEAAYIAGIMDGEGSIFLFQARTRNNRIAIRMSVSNTDLDLLEWIREKTGIGSIVTKPSKNPKHKNANWWQANAEAAEHVLTQILPYLVIKREQAEIALETQRRLRIPEMKIDLTWQQEFFDRCQFLNRRGPAELNPPLPQRGQKAEPDFTLTATP